MHEKIIFAFVLHQQEEKRVKLKAFTDAFKLYANGFLLIDFVEKNHCVCCCCLAWLCILPELTIEKKQPRRRCLHIKTMIIGVLGNYD